MLDFCSKHNIVAEIERINIQDVNKAFERLEKGDVKYRFVIDDASFNNIRSCNANQFFQGNICWYFFVTSNLHMKNVFLNTSRNRNGKTTSWQ